MKITITKKDPEKYNGDMLVYFIEQAKDNKPPTTSHILLKEKIKLAFSVRDFEGKIGQTFMFYPEQISKASIAKRILAMGVGKEKVDRDILRELGGDLANAANKTKASKIMVVLPEFLDVSVEQIGECLTEGLILANYNFSKYKNYQDDQSEPNLLTEVIFAVKKDRQVRKGIQKGLCAAQAACRARDMANEPANNWTADHFSSYSQYLAKEYGLKRKVLSKDQLVKLKMGGLIGVNQGSAVPPKMIIMEYRTGKKVPTVLIVGKGLTFDSGGISIKPSSGMQDMKYDMCGGAAVLACMQAIGNEKPKNVDVIAIVPATENMPGPAAIKPGDIIRQYNGKTVEVINTDAEGRLILADALSFGIDKYKPDAVIDIATLTGAVIVGLGHHYAGLISNDDSLTQKIIKSSKNCGEPVWRLPLNKDYTKQLKSNVADLKNVADKGGGTITAGAFLQEFIGETKWAHLDIAGTAWNFTEKSYVPKGPSGFGVRLLVDLLRSW